MLVGQFPRRSGPMHRNGYTQQPAEFIMMKCDVQEASQIETQIIKGSKIKSALCVTTFLISMQYW
jgi:hypothetical protein